MSSQLQIFKHSKFVNLSIFFKNKCKLSGVICLLSDISIDFKDLKIVWVSLLDFSFFVNRNMFSRFFLFRLQFYSNKVSSLGKFWINIPSYRYPAVLSIFVAPERSRYFKESYRLLSFFYIALAKYINLSSYILVFLKISF